VEYEMLRYTNNHWVTGTVNCRTQKMSGNNTRKGFS